MIPPPIKTTSGQSVLLVAGMASFPKEIERVGIWDATFVTAMRCSPRSVIGFRHEDRRVERQIIKARQQD
jgi:hypothetical protein